MNAVGKPKRRMWDFPELSWGILDYSFIFLTDLHIFFCQKIYILKWDISAMEIPLEKITSLSFAVPIPGLMITK